MNRSSRYKLILSKRPFRLLAIAAIFFFFGLLLDYNFVAPEIDPSQETLPAATMRALLWAVLLLMTGVISLLFEALLAARPSGEQYNEQIKNRVRREAGDNEGSSIWSKKLAKLGGDFKHLKIFEKFNLGVLIVDGTGEILAANLEFLNKTGYTEADLIGNKAIAVLGDGGINEKDNIENRNRGKGEIYEHTINHKDGGIGRYYTAGIPLYDESKNVAGSAGVILDITDMHQYQAQLEQALSREVELSTMKSHFVAMASHQFRTPLAIIQNNVELMAMTTKLGKESSANKFFEYEKRIHKEVRNITNLMNEVLALEKVTAGKLKAKKKKTDVAQLCEQVTTKMSEIMDGNRRVTLTIEGERTEVFIDDILLANSLENLISNASKYSEGTNPEVKLKFNERGLSIEVIDEGIGIPEDALDSIFTPFFRAPNTGNIQGHGLGLSIVMEYVGLNGGSFEIDSVLGKGTTARMVFGPESLVEKKRTNNNENKIECIVL